MGFSKTMYFSKEERALNDIIDQKTTSNVDGFYQEELPSSVKSGDFAKSLQNGVNFFVFDETQQSERKIESIDEIVISTSLFSELGYHNLGEDLYVMTSKNELLVSGNKIIKDYVLTKLKIVGLVKSNKLAIYHNKNWTILFYQSLIGISAFNLQCQTLSFSLKEPGKIDSSIELAKKAFPQYEVVNPLSNINDSVDKTCFYITFVLIIFSTVATIISILLLTICNYLYVLEGRKEIALARCLGVNKKESRKFVFYNSLVQCFLSFFIASIELVIISLVANLEVSQSLAVGMSFSFDPISLLPMLGLALVISLFSSALMSRRINKINPIEALKA